MKQMKKFNRLIEQGYTAPHAAQIAELEIAFAVVTLVTLAGAVAVLAIAIKFF
jgi:hypothetical protein